MVGLGLCRQRMRLLIHVQDGHTVTVIRACFVGCIVACGFVQCLVCVTFLIIRKRMSAVLGCVVCNCLACVMCSFWHAFCLVLQHQRSLHSQARKQQKDRGSLRIIARFPFP